MMTFARTNVAAPYNPLSRSFIKVALSSRKLGTYATAMKDINADPKNYNVLLAIKGSKSSYNTYYGILVGLDRSLIVSKP